MRPNCSSHDSSERPCFQNLLLESCYYLFVSLIWFSMIILLHFRAFEPTPPSVSRMAPESFFSLRSSSLLLSSLLRFRGLPVSRLSAHASQVTLPNSAYTLYTLSVLCLSSLLPHFRDFAACIRSHRSMRSILRFQFPDNWLPALPAGSSVLKSLSRIPLIRCISSQSFAFSSLSPRRSRSFGGLKWSRTTDLMLIRHAL